MKKAISIILASVMMLALAACTQENQAQESTQAEATEVEANDDKIAAAVEENIEDTATDTEAEIEITEPISLKIGVPCAPPAMPLLHMIDTNALGDNVTIEIDRWDEPEALLAMVQDGQHQMYAFPLTMIAKLYNKGMDVRLMNVNTWGVTYFLTSDPDFDEWSDLKGKTVYIPLQTSPPDALTQFFINEAGLIPGEDVEIIYASPAEVSALLISGEAKYATQIEPMCTQAMMKNPDVRVAFSIEEEWQRVNDTDGIIPNAGFGTTQKFIDERPEVVEKFNQEYAKALEWVKENPEEAGALMEAEFGIKAQLVSAAIPNMGLHFETAVEADEDLDMLYDLLLDFEPKMLGGSLPDEGMYYAG